jgi:hypothetical protein
MFAARRLFSNVTVSSRHGAEMLTRINVLFLAVALVSAPVDAAAADVQPKTIAAWNTYIDEARRAFITRSRESAAAARTPARISAAPARGDGITNVAGGLIHHWIGRAFIPSLTLQRAVEVSQAYGAYAEVYESIIASQVLKQQGDVFRVLLRLREGGAGVTAVLDLHSTVTYSRRGDDTVIAISDADEIREVENPGRPTERLRPAGRDSGYLWRASTFTYLQQRAGGLYIEMETVGLSREFPPLLGWIIEPIAKHLGRRSVEASLQEFSAAVRAQ